MADDYGHYDDDAEPAGRDHLFLWTVFILLLIGAAFACWLGSFYIFGHPEKARPYAILKKLGKIEAPRRVEVTAAPIGEFFTASKLFEKYSSFSRLQLEQENDELMRIFIKNYRETNRRVPYIIGRFEIVDTYELGAHDLFPSGVVAFASSNEFPQVQLEHVFTCAPQDVAGLRANLPRGLDMRLERTLDLAAIIHVERTNDGYLQFTSVPLNYGSWGVKGSVGVFSLEPPAGVNLVAGAPIVRGQGRLEAMRAYTEYRRRQPAAAEGTDKEPAPERELVRLDTVKPGTAVPATGGLPNVPIATPVPTLAGGKPGAGRPSPTPVRVASLQTPRPQPPAATPLPTATPLAVATPLPGRNVPIKPFFQSQPVADLSGSNNQQWQTYRPGRLPAGRTVTASEASSLAERGELSERLYLKGDFVVTAAGESRAVLRAQGAGAEPGRPGAGSARIIVEYPTSVAPPSEGALFNREDGRGFEIRDVRRTSDGQVNIYVREIAQGE